ncbi:hypothetical protein [Sphingomonas mollis]|uniref:Uncharacterized protein n=1 Tax=Sphingomonas mollis TaxID=2795726 RepID=A0ABS0XTP3_9SPHN|nr:hypothetical protein [Sphingomonas sp. BT553]MBJ6123392.1 hypothetical protein [Sphingomonas sp. BT553]
MTETGKRLAMYMGPIVAAKSSSSPLARVLVGIPTLMLAAMLLLPWLAANAMAAGLMLGLRALPGAPRALMAAIDYAGTVALGR